MALKDIIKNFKSMFTSKTLIQIPEEFIDNSEYYGYSYNYGMIEGESARALGYEFTHIEQLYQMIYSKDSTFKHTIRQLWHRVAELDWEIKYENVAIDDLQRAEEIQNFIKKEFDKFDVSDIIGDILTALIYKKSIIQVEYEMNDDLNIGLASNRPLKLRNPSNFELNINENELYFSTNYFEESILIEHSQILFLTTINRANNFLVGGESDIGEAGFWLFHFKRLMLQSWVKASERFAIPREALYYDKTELAQQGIKNAFSQGKKILADMNKNVKVVLPKGYDLQTFEAKLTQNISYADSVDFFNKSITKLLLNSELTGSTSKYGNYATAQIHETTEYAKIETLAKMVENTLNKLIEILINLNFEDVSPLPKFHINYKREVFYTDEKLNELKVFETSIVELKTPVFVIDYMNSLNLRIPDDIDPNSTYNGYVNTNGEYVPGLLDEHAVNSPASEVEVVEENVDEIEVNKEEEINQNMEE